jgi:hypothetical protein
MTQQNPTFNISDYELRNYTDPYLTEDQASFVAEAEDRVNSQLDFVAQMLGWNGPNYWGNLPSTVSQKRQLLSGTFGVYNSYIIPKIYEIRNWDNTFVVDRLQFLEPGRQTYVEKIVLGNESYQLRGVKVEGDKYIISIGVLPDSFYTQIAANVPLKVDIPTYRPAPFYRPQVGASGDNVFCCKASGTNLILYPGYDTANKFPYKFPILFVGSVYYFNQPVFLSYTDTLSQDITPTYDATLELWSLQIPPALQVDSVGLTAYLVWGYSNRSTAVNATLEVKLQSWYNPSDWGSQNVLDNFTGAWGNKGGYLPFNLAFDSLGIHSFSEENSLYLPPVERTASFNDLVGLVYSQDTPVDQLPPPPKGEGDLWWNDSTGVMATWVEEDSGCGAWVEVDYREQPSPFPPPQVVYPDVATFVANSGSLVIGTTVRIEDITGLAIAQNVLGVQGTLTSPGYLVLFRADSSPYWTPMEFGYVDVPTFEADAELLPYGVPTIVYDSTGLAPSASTYSVSNLDITITGDYEVTLTKVYTNKTWVASADSTLKYIANSALFGSPVEGEMWWDFANPDPNTRAACIYYQSAWVDVNVHAASGIPAPVLDMGSIRFYCDGFLLSDNTVYDTDNYQFIYISNPLTGEYTFKYSPKNLVGKTNLPTITVSDSLTTVYQADISNIVYSGITYYMSPNVYDAEKPLRIWKAQDLQVAETVAHLLEDNYTNPLLADLNNGPGPENWEKYFIRLPLDYGRDGVAWQKTSLVAQDFAYWGSTMDPEVMECPPEDDLPAIYEELFLYDQPIPDYTYVYCEPYLYSNIAYFDSGELGNYRNSGVFPATDQQFDEFTEAELIDYEPLHNRQADVKSPVGAGYGNWLGDYVNVNPCVALTGFYTTDLLNRGVSPVAAPSWDASIYKYAPTCENDRASYNVDANHYKIGYAYFVADASAAEDGFFDIQKEISWRDPVAQPKTGYLIPA